MASGSLRALALAGAICGLLVPPLAAVEPASAAAVTPFRIGLVDSSYRGRSTEILTQSYEDISSAGAAIVRLNVFWSEVAPRRPPRGTKADDPRNPGYDWTEIDNSVRAATDRGLFVMLSVGTAPRWAEGPRRPRHATPGSWRPSVGALRNFARAAARRYSGRIPDPARPARRLARVVYWQAWNEPNLPAYLSPQWTYRGARALAASPAYYRRMLNAFYLGVKSVRKSNQVLAAGTAPYGDPEGFGRMRPAVFLRELLCLRGRRLKSFRCPRPARFDIFAHHPYAVTGPRKRAFDQDDIAIPDLSRLQTIMRVAVRRGRALPKKPKPLWITEFGWDSSPPDPGGVPGVTHAYWLQQTLYYFWRQGVKSAMWLLLRDQPPQPSYAVSLQSGLRFNDGLRKAAHVAFRMPFYVGRLSGGRLRVWGRPPHRVPVAIERLAGGGWVQVARLPLRRDGTFMSILRIAPGSRLRARTEQDISLSYDI